MNDNEHRFTEVVSAVTVTEPVNGTEPQKKRSRGSATNRRRVIHEKQITVDPRVWEAAKQVCRPGQRVRIVSEVEVLVVNR